MKTAITLLFLALLLSSCAIFPIGVKEKPTATAAISPIALPTPKKTAISLPSLEHARLATLTLDGQVFDATFSPDGSSVMLAFNSDSRLVLARWDLSAATRTDSQDDLRLTPTSCPARDVDLAITPDGSLLAVSVGKAVILVDALSGEILDAPDFISPYTPLNLARSITFSPSGNRYVIGASSLMASDFVGREYPDYPEYFQGFSNPIDALYVGPEYDEARASGLFEAHVLAYSPDGRQLAAGGGRFIGLWDAQTGVREQMLLGYDFVQSISFAPDGRSLVFVSDNGKLYWWDLSGNVEPRLILDGGAGMDAIYSPDGKWLAVGMSNGFIQFWDSTMLYKVDEIQAHASRVTSVHFSPDGSRLLSSSYDGSITVWDVSAALVAAPALEQRTSPVGSLSPLIDGQPLTLESIHMLNASEGWAIDSTRHLLRTSDGGVHWRDVSPTTMTFSAEGLFILNGSTAWVTPEIAPCYRPACPPADLMEGTVWRTVDGGGKWEASQPFRLGRVDGSDNVVPYYRPVALQFVDAQHGWLLISVDQRMRRDFYRLFHTADGGATWSRQADETNGPPLIKAFGIAFLDAQRGSLLGEGMDEFINYDHVYLTENSGANWRQTEYHEKLLLSGLVPEQICSLRSLRARALSTSVMSIDVVTQMFQAGGCSPALIEKHVLLAPWETRKDRHIWKSTGDSYFMNDTLGWMLVIPGPGQSNYLQYTRDGAATWRVIRRVAWEKARFSFVDEREGWAIVTTDNVSALVHTIDGGTTWEEIKPFLVSG